MTVDVIELGVFGLTIKGNSITSDLHESDETEIEKAYFDAIESMVLAHHVAGINITTPAYKEGIEVAVESFYNNQ